MTTTEIGLLSKIVAVVDEYDDLCNSPDSTRTFTPYEALSYLYAKKRGALWEEAIVALVHMLSVYPPGSIVTLSDGSYGVVSSVNPHARMQPLVMLYAPDISREEALIIDLSTEQDLAITQNLRPKEVSKEIRDYLNPRRIISYFPSQPETTAIVPCCKRSPDVRQFSFEFGCDFIHLGLIAIFAVLNAI